MFGGFPHVFWSWSLHKNMNTWFAWPSPWHRASRIFRKNDGHPWPLFPFVFFSLLLSLDFHFVEHLHSNVKVDQNSVKLRGFAKPGKASLVTTIFSDPPRSRESTRECHETKYVESRKFDVHINTRSRNIGTEPKWNGKVSRT